jgi:hypothetical protein
MFPELSSDSPYIKISRDVGKGCVFHIHIYRDTKNAISRKTLIFRDLDKNLVALWATHAQKLLKEKIEALPALVHSLFPQELSEDDSKRVGFEFCAIHMSQYNRYAENVRVLSISTVSVIKLIDLCFEGNWST